MTRDVEKAERDLKLVKDRLRGGMSWAKLGMKYKISDRQARRIFEDWAKNNQGKSIKDFSGRDPVEIVWESAQRFESWIEELGEVKQDADTDPVRISAINAQVSVQEKMLALLQASGILPKNLGRLRIEADIRYVAQTILTIFEEEGVDQRVQKRIFEALSTSVQQSPN